MPVARRCWIRTNGMRRGTTKANLVNELSGLDLGECGEVTGTKRKNDFVNGRVLEGHLRRLGRQKTR